jgi:hypothetical protein
VTRQGGFSLRNGHRGRCGEVSEASRFASLKLVRRQGGTLRLLKRQTGDASLTEEAKRGRFAYHRRLIAGPEALRIFPVCRGKKRKFLLKISGMLGCSNGDGDLFSIPENGDGDIFVSSEKEGSIKDIGR